MDSQEKNEILWDASVKFNEAFEEFMKTADAIFESLDGAEGDAILMNTLLDYVAAFFAEHYDMSRGHEVNSLLVDAMINNFRDKLERAIILKTER